MRHIQSIDEFPFQCGAIIHYSDGGWRVALKLWHTRWHRWYLLLPPRRGALVECCKRDDEADD